MFEGVGVSTGSYLGGYLMDHVQGSATFRFFSYGAFIFFGVHVFVQWAINKIAGPYGKKSARHVSESPDNKSREALEANKIEGGQEKVDDGFKDIDLTR